MGVIKCPSAPFQPIILTVQKNGDLWRRTLDTPTHLTAWLILKRRVLSARGNTVNLAPRKLINELMHCCPWIPHRDAYVFYAYFYELMDDCRIKELHDEYVFHENNGKKHKRRKDRAYTYHTQCIQNLINSIIEAHAP